MAFGSFGNSIGGIFSKAETAVFGPSRAGIGVAQSPGFPGANLTTSAAPSPDIGRSIFDAPGQIPGAVPGTDVFGRPDSGIGKLGQFGPGLTPLPSLTPDFSTFDASKFGLGNLDISTPGGKFTFDPDTGFNFTSGLGGLRSRRARAFVKAADDLETQAAAFDFGPLTAARREAFDIARDDLSLRESEEIGSLKDQLGARRVLGASFATAQISRERKVFRAARRDLANREAQVLGASKLEELNLKTDLLTRANSLRIQGIQTEITEIFGETQFAGQLFTQIAAIMEMNLRARLFVESEDLQQQRNLAQRERESLRGDFQATKAGEREESRGFGRAAGFILDRIFGGGIF